MVRAGGFPANQDDNDLHSDAGCGRGANRETTVDVERRIDSLIVWGAVAAVSTLVAAAVALVRALVEGGFGIARHIRLFRYCASCRQTHRLVLSVRPAKVKKR